MRLTFTLPFPVPLNNLYPTGPNKRRYLSKRGKVYKAEVKSITYPPIKLSGELSDTFYITPPDKRRRDLDGLLKCPIDALQEAGIFDDDSQIKMITARMYPADKAEAGCIVTLEEVG